MVPDTDRAYIAGLIDGEGCIRIWRVSSARQLARMHRRTPIYNPWCSITNCHVETLRWIQALYGGRLQPYKGKAAWTLVLTSRMADRIIRDVLPFLRIKRAQAEVVLEFYQDTIVYGRKGVPEAEVRRREELYAQALTVNPFSHQHRLSVVPPVEELTG